MSLKDHLDKLGLGGSLFAALCCLGFPAVLSFMTAIGLGFLLQDAILLPVLGAFLLVTLYGLYRGFKVHRRKLPMILGGASSVALFAFIFVSTPAAYVAIGGVILATVLNVVLA